MSILVLPLDEEFLARVRREAEARGWDLDVSRGEEQVIVGVSGDGDVGELMAALPAGEVDLVELRSRGHYTRRRRRRRLLNVMVASLGLVIAVGWAVPIFGFLQPPPVEFRTPDVLRVAVEQLLPGSARRLWFGEHQVLLVRGEGGDFFALDGACTFMEDCLLEWDPGPQRVVCPCHGCAFDVHGNIVAGPPWIPLPSYAVERVGAHLHVQRRN